jgi:hypothetical protein
MNSPAIQKAKEKEKASHAHVRGEVQCRSVVSTLPGAVGTLLYPLCLKRLRREMPNQGLIEVVQLPRRILLRVSRWNDGDEGKRIGGGRVRAPQVHAETDIEPASGW